MAFQVVSDENSDEKQAKKDLLIQIINFFNKGQTSGMPRVPHTLQLHTANNFYGSLTINILTHQYTILIYRNEAVHSEIPSKCTCSAGFLHNSSLELINPKT